MRRLVNKHVLLSTVPGQVCAELNVGVRLRYTNTTQTQEDSNITNHIHSLNKISINTSQKLEIRGEKYRDRGQFAVQRI